MNDYVIRVENLSKKYTISTVKQKKTRMLRDVITENFTHSVQTLGRSIGLVSGISEKQKGSKIFWALHDINFSVQPGESIGIIGSNGAGKSTLLKIISRITWPTTGRVHVRGRVGSLLEVGTGFHNELTGRENVFLNGAVLGMKRQEILKKFDEIVAFSEVDNFIDTPVKRYSSGMKMRLAFSVAAHLDPEIMLVDEVLAVGDIAFQQKSINKMSDVIGDGRTVLFVSHNIAAVRALCQKAIYLKEGCMQAFGNVDEVAQIYLNTKQIYQSEYTLTEHNSKKAIQILSASVIDHTGNPSNLLPHDQPFSIRISLAVNKPAMGDYLTLKIYNQELETILVTHDFEQDESVLSSRQTGFYSIDIKINAPLLVPGQYLLGFGITRKRTKGDLSLQKQDHVVPFDIFDNGSSLAKTNTAWKGFVHTPIHWEFTKIKDLIYVPPQGE